MSKTLGIAFGGSGAEGIACLSYVKALEEADIRPDIVSGTGIGGVVAAMFAAGMSFKEMMDFLVEIDFPGSRRPINIAKLKDSKRGLLDDMGLEEYFKMVVPIRVFDRLYFPLRIVATEFKTGAEAVFSEGDVGHAVRAGVAVPGIFSPFEIGEALYIDGSCVNPVPFDIIRDDCEVLTAIAPGTYQQTEENRASANVFPALMGAYEAAKKSLSTEKKKHCNIDVYEDIIIEGISPFDFSRYDDIIAFAQENAERFVLNIHKLL